MEEGKEKEGERPEGVARERESWHSVKKSWHSVRGELKIQNERKIMGGRNGRSVGESADERIPEGFAYRVLSSEDIFKMEEIK